MCIVAARIERSGVDFYPTVIVNRSKTLPCEVVGVPRPTITWYKDGTLLDPDNPSPQSVGVSILDDGAKLEIESSSLNDSGTYQCRAENAAGQDRVHYRLKVYGVLYLVVVVVVVE